MRERQPTGAASATRPSCPRRAALAGAGYLARCRYCASGGGTPAPGWQAHPSPSPRASRADPCRRPPASLPNVKVVLTRRAPAGARSHDGRVEGDAMARTIGRSVLAFGIVRSRFRYGFIRSREEGECQHSVIFGVVSLYRNSPSLTNFMDAD
jgi:hypothetical protein